MKHPKRKLHIAVAGVLGAAFALQAPLAGAQQTQKIEKIEVTGSNIKRIEGEGALPVTVITRDDIQKSGVTTAAELIDRLSANSGGGYNVSQGVGDSGHARPVRGVAARPGQHQHPDPPERPAPVELRVQRVRRRHGQPEPDPAGRGRARRDPEGRRLRDLRHRRHRRRDQLHPAQGLHRRRDHRLRHA